MEAANTINAARIRSALTATSTGKEVMPDDNDNSNPRPEISPGVTAGAAQDVVGLIGLARLLLDTGFSQFGETVDYSPKVTEKVLDLLDAAIARMKEAGE